MGLRIDEAKIVVDGFVSGVEIRLGIEKIDFGADILRGNW